MIRTIVLNNKLQKTSRREQKRTQFNVAGKVVLPPLPFEKKALAPHISEETVDFHYEKHHRGYVNNLNIALENSPLKNTLLEDLIRNEQGKVFNLSAQIWNHTFYWNSLSPNGGGEPTGEIAELINRDFGSFEDFKAEFSTIAGGHFGSGWAWLVQRDNGKLEIVDTHDAATPLKENTNALLTCDVWEHAYYIDYRNARPEYVKAWWNLVNWDFANKNLLKQ
eukprot:TRINITY_DN13654_c0_g1_i1.p1 TRINITY_DN13654_c0_g1~~TRINITY_DN13654_c0_g1_i1.p1  ORF type:complete len:237 (+),score=62.98 TRINITY_DN13654_c0_g1_i1:47-712(+)